jgi:hypothetical protein
MAGQPRPAARHPESHDPQVAGRGQEQDAGDEERHHTDRAKRNAARGQAWSADPLHPPDDREERECDRDRQRRRIDPAGPWRYGADGRQRRTDKVRGHQAADRIAQDRGSSRHHRHCENEQQSAAAVGGAAFFHQ